MNLLIITSRRTSIGKAFFTESMRMTVVMALPRLSVWGEAHKTIMGIMVVICHLPLILDVVVAMLLLTGSAIMVLHRRLLSFTPACTGRAISLEEVGGIIINLLSINYPPAGMGEVFILQSKFNFNCTLSL